MDPRNPSPTHLTARDRQAERASVSGSDMSNRSSLAHRLGVAALLVIIAVGLAYGLSPLLMGPPAEKGFYLFDCERCMTDAKRGTRCAAVGGFRSFTAKPGAVELGVSEGDHLEVLKFPLHPTDKCVVDPRRNFAFECGPAGSSPSEASQWVSFDGASQLRISLRGGTPADSVTRCRVGESSTSSRR